MGGGGGGGGEYEGVTSKNLVVHFTTHVKAYSVALYPYKAK